MNKALNLTGIGLRAEHYQAFLADFPKVAWVEVHSENFFATGGRVPHILSVVRDHYPISLHGIGLSLGSTDLLNWDHLKALKRLIDHINPCLISDHLSWSSVNGQYISDLLPLPLTTNTLTHLSGRIEAVQQYLGRQLLIENISQYINFENSNWEEADFLNELAKRTGCGILLDVNNVFVTTHNLLQDPIAFIDTINPKYVQEIHLAGHSETMIANDKVLIDSHNQLITQAVWDLYTYTITRLGRKPTLVEWDSDLPDITVLWSEAHKANQIMKNHHAISTFTTAIAS